MKGEVISLTHDFLVPKVFNKHQDVLQLKIKRSKCFIDGSTLQLANSEEHTKGHRRGYVHGR